MDDHLYDAMMEYAQRYLIPQFQQEYREHKKMSVCPSYKEIQGLCKALNAIAPYAGFNNKRPSDFLPLEYRRY